MVSSVGVVTLVLGGRHGVDAVGFGHVAAKNLKVGNLFVGIASSGIDAGDAAER